MVFEEQLFVIAYLAANAAAMWVGLKTFLGSWKRIRRSRWTGIVVYTGSLFALGALYWRVVGPALRGAVPLFTGSSVGSVVNPIVLIAVPCGLWLLPGLALLASTSMFFHGTSRGSGKD